MGNFDVFKYTDSNMLTITDVVGEAFYGCESLETVVIPNSVTYIGYEAFCECNSLTSVIIPDSVTEIGELAFKCCKSLTDVVIPNGVTEIKSETFRYCYSLTVGIPESVTTIGKFAFDGCNIEKLFISNNIKEIGSCAFGNGGVDEIVFDGTEEEWERINHDGWDDATTSTTDIGFNSYILRKTETGCIICWEPCTIVDSGDGLLEHVWCSLDRKILVKSLYEVSSYTVPDGVIKIGKEAFKFRESLETIVIPGIGSSAFENCNSLKKVIFKGTKEQWEQIRIYEDNAPLLDAEIEFSPQGGQESG